MTDNVVRISVRNLVEFVLRSGSIDNRFLGSSMSERALEGTKAHQKIQMDGGEEYISEIQVKYQTEYQDFSVIIEGRIDGVLLDNGSPVIDEIKTTTLPMEMIDEDLNPLHWAQAKCYGFIYAEQNGLNSLDIQLTYFNVDTQEIKKIRKPYELRDLKEFFFSIVDRYLVWARLSRDWCAKRDASARALQFPFSTYRQGQREMAVAVYKTIEEAKKLFVQAPTGTGKTISTLFPAVKAMGESKTGKIFYLTAKTIARQVAEEAIDRMRACGLAYKSITLTAKEKICFKEHSNCNPEYCEFAQGHFDRVDDAIWDIFNNESSFTRDAIEAYSKKHRVCPFEFSLDLSLWADAVICDYNYAFDPRVYLKRFFQYNGGDYTFLIDEAHNLVDRSREMFSAEIYKSWFLQLRRRYNSKKTGLYKALSKVNSALLELRKKNEPKSSYVQSEEPKEIYKLLKDFTKEAENFLSQARYSEDHSELLEVYFNVLGFLRIAEFYDDSYVTYMERYRSEVRLKIFCLDPSYRLREALQRGRSAIFFSATLTPIEYFRDILGGDEADYRMVLSSPFDRDNLCLAIVSSISTKYANREKSYEEIAKYIHEAISKKTGNYLVYFPSYKYMEEVLAIFEDMFPDAKTIAQSNTMTEEEREAFLDQFKPTTDELLIGFAVMGGIFSEGIDLKGDRLLGAIIVGVGLPQICLERDIILDYFRDKNGLGFEYAYMYPGMNKVLQAAGRVIRSEEDKGIVLLIDERFANYQYKKLYPRHWSHYKEVATLEELGKHIQDFWT